MTMQKYTVLSATIILSIIAFIYINIAVQTDDSLTSDALTIAGLNGCSIQNNYCEFALDQQNFEVSLPEGAKIEEESFVNITSNQGFVIEAIWIEGVNMYMGRSPVIAEIIEDTRFNGLFFLGSCNTAKMEWVMKIQLAKKTHPVEVRFSTSM
ncbi:hypothetical protein QTP81_09540 [Alteromonas sp. ASW11-36]|uniref:Uncharacterized protein n=1 Tax=Alteromonas arenosi TaxID=3055817 RepID=A0ABT7SZ61_9ALTE|nr:hypothetical protein [Alteromonas sp. ASW11-36]MDM7860837.1 hypothetical protein [Alteromonas sp. ASW11-36]